MDKILLVDDDPNILEGYKRQLRKQFLIETSLGGEEGLALIQDQGPFAVVVSDMRMPVMDGVQFLSRVKQLAPDTVRIMLTGDSNQQTAVDAVNVCNVFRFLSKPCPHDTLALALEEALEQHRSANAEQELLTNTLGGGVCLLAEILSLVSPIAFGRASRVRRFARKLCHVLEVENSWDVELAAMLSMVGCIAVPEIILGKISRNIELTPQEYETFLRHPQIGSDLIARIPRMEKVAKIIAYQEKRFDGSGTPDDLVAGENIPVGSRILKVAHDFNNLVGNGMNRLEAYGTIHSRNGWYDLNVVEALKSVAETQALEKTVTVARLQEGMVLEEHITTQSGEVLIVRDQEVTSTMREKLKVFLDMALEIKEPIRVSCPVESLEPELSAAGA